MRISRALISASGSELTRAGARRSWTDRRAAAERTFRAILEAVAYSQPAAESCQRTAEALRARVKNVAWKASSASRSFGRTRRQTRNTIGPCRWSSVAKTSSSRWTAKRCNSSRSEIAAGGGGGGGGLRGG